MGTAMVLSNHTIRLSAAWNAFWYWGVWAFCIIGDQFLKPLLDVIPGADLLQLHELPYMFLLMVGVALIRKPGCVTAMVFVNFLLAQLLFAGAGLPIGIVSNTGWSIDQGYAATGLDAFVQTFVLSCDLGIAKPDPAPFEIACERLGVLPERTLMVGNNRLADSGSICVGCHCLILPPVPPGATRGLRAAVDVAGIAWAQ
jgi:hypothetical protein